MDGLAWWTDFLSNRKQRVKIRSSCSEWSLVTSGVPQGSVTGPVCFAAVNERLRTNFLNSEFIKYADDNTLIHYVRNQNDDRLQEEFDLLQTQIRELGMVLNTSKTKELQIVTKNVSALKCLLCLLMAVLFK